MLIILIALMTPIHADAQAPTSFAGDSLWITVTSGTYPLADTGYCLFLFTSSGNDYRIIGIDGIENDSGNYSYSSLGTTGTAYLADNIAGSEIVTADFSTPSSGSYNDIDTTYSLSQNGNFEMFSTQVPNSIVGMAMTCTVQNGVYPFAYTGTFILNVATSGETYTVIGDGVNTRDSSGSYSYSSINGTTGAMQINDSVLGVATAYLAFSSATAGDFAVKSSSTSSFQIGHFALAATGSLTVSINPASAVTAGGQWQVDGGTWQNSGATVSGLSVGNHTVSFNTISGWATPANQNVAVSANSTATTGGAYVQQFGSLLATISPASAVTAGAQWQVDGGTWQNSGATVSNLLVRDHIVSFNTISGWTTPANQTIAVSANSTATASGTYVQQFGFLQVTISPASVIAAGAKWRVDGGAWRSSGVMVSGLSAGNHTVSFNTVGGWVAPTSQNIAVSADSIASTSGTYVAIATLQVTIGPAAVITAGAQWQVDGGTWQNSGATVSNLLVCDHIVSFAGIDNWGAPGNQTVSIKAKSVVKVMASYTFNGTGIYNGLFMQAGTSAETAGMLSGLDVTASGTYSGKLLIGGGTNYITGSFNASGQASNYVQRTATHGGPLTLEMRVNWNDSPLNIAGTISGTNGGPWMASLTNELAVSGASSAEYTALLLPNGTPTGYGYMLITNHSGTVTLSVTVANGTAFSQSVPLSGKGDLPVYGDLYGGAGLLIGWINLEGGSPTGNLTWIKPASRSAALYPNGFTNLVSVQGSLWTNPSPHTAAIDLPAGQLDISGGGLLSPLTFNVAVSNNNALVKLPGSPTNSLTGSINPKTGLLTVTFGDGIGRTTVVGHGAALQNTNVAAGFFLGKTTAGSILLQP